MGSRTPAVLLILTSIYFIMAIAAEVLIDDFVKPHSLFTYLLASTLVTTSAAMLVDKKIRPVN